MSISRAELHEYCQNLLHTKVFKDYCYNGVQVEGCDQIKRIASSCTASLQACESAVADDADALFVHHGIIWGSIDRVDGMCKQRLSCLLTADCSLFAYHLPLDADETWGNNRCAFDLLDIPVSGTFANYKGQDIGLWGSLDTPISAHELSNRCQTAFQHAVVHCPGADRPLQKIGVVTGGGQSLHMDAAALGLDALITGECSEPNWHQAAESGCHLFACGHHATEAIAIHKFCAHLAEKFDLEHHIIDQVNPI